MQKFLKGKLRGKIFHLTQVFVVLVVKNTGCLSLTNLHELNRILLDKDSILIALQSDFFFLGVHIIHHNQLLEGRVWILQRSEDAIVVFVLRKNLLSPLQGVSLFVEVDAMLPHRHI